MLREWRVFLDNVVGIMKEVDVGLGWSVVWMDKNGLRLMEKLVDVVLVEVVEMNERERCKRREEEEVREDGDVVCCDRCVDEEVNVLFGEKVCCGVLLVVVIWCEWVF